MDRKHLKVTLLVVAGVLAIFGLPLAVRWFGISTNEFLAVPSLITSWPVVVLILCLVLMFKFRSALDYLIRYGRWKLPGGVEVQSMSPEEASGAFKLSPAQQAQLARFIQALQQQQQIAVTQSQQMLRNAILWEFAFLDRFFVSATKQVLTSIAQASGGVQRAFLDSVWQQLIPDPTQRRVILDVLLYHNVVVEQNGQLTVTQKGLAFLGFLQSPEYPQPHSSGG